MRDGYTTIERAVREEMDAVFAAVLWQIGSLPEFFTEDLEFGSQVGEDIALRDRLGLRMQHGPV
jgi:hypothetical protein